MPNTDDLLTAYSHPLRRFLVFQLYSHDTETSLEEISEEAAQRLSKAPSDPDVIRTNLYHRHLPKLEKSNLIEWETERQTVRLDNFGQEAEKLIQTIAEVESWT